MTVGRIHSFESFGSADGPGVRFVVFLQGCHMRCLYCHNPDTWDLNAKNVTLMTPEELLKKIIRYKNYWGQEGGITISGGEPLLQIDFLIELFTLAKEMNINTCIDTAGQPFTNTEEYLSKFNRLMSVTDLVMLDIKHIDADMHKIITKQRNSNILEMLDYLNKINKDVWIRHVLVPTYTDDKESLERLKHYLDKYDNIKKIEVLPYHTFGIHKYELLNIEYPLKDINPPKKEIVDMAKYILEK